MKRFLIPLLVIIVAVLGAMTLTATAPKLEPSAAEPVPVSVRVLQVRPESVRLTVHSQGTAMPTVESDLVPEVFGRVVHMSPSMITGGSFEAGDILLQIDPADYESAVDRASATLARAEAELEHARFELERQRELAERQLSSRSVFENAQRVFRVADASVNEARVALDQAKRDLQRTRITAPFSGLVRSEQVDLGQFVTRGSAIAKIYATDTVEVRLPLADKQLAFLNLPPGVGGQLLPEQRPRVILTTDYAGRTYRWDGEVIRTEAEIDLKSRMVNVVARIDNTRYLDAPLSVGMYVEAEIEGIERLDIVVLPRSTLRNGNRVLVVDDQNRLQYRDVELLRLYRDKVMIRQGLKADELVCVSSLQTVVEGMVVQPVAEAQEG